MRVRARHLPDDRLFDCYLSAHGGELVDPPAAEHLVDCAECAARYGELTRFMDALRDEATAETDAAFPPEQLATQRQQIALRLEHLGHAARVLSFPARIPARQIAAVRRTAPRWAAAAAAAGLVVGVSAGLWFDRAAGLVQGERSAPARAPYTAAPTPAPATTPAALPAPSSDDDDTFLSEVEMAMGGPRTRELAAFDAVTPRVQEISARVR